MAFFNGRRLQLANWASRHALPMTSGSRDISEVGGLMSYGTNIGHVVMREFFRSAAVQTLKGL
jgi:hypothetical protein